MDVFYYAQIKIENGDNYYKNEARKYEETVIE